MSEPTPEDEVDPAIQKVLKMLGDDRGWELVRETMRAAGLERITTADDRLRFGDALIPQGGLLEAIGRSVKAQAFLQGAKLKR